MDGPTNNDPSPPVDIEAMTDFTVEFWIKAEAAGTVAVKPSGIISSLARAGYPQGMITVRPRAPWFWAGTMFQRRKKLQSQR